MKPFSSLKHPHPKNNNKKKTNHQTPLQQTLNTSPDIWELKSVESKTQGSLCDEGTGC